VENPLNQSSNLSKHVSFCEEPEVFVNHVNPDWSTDTDTPDDDSSRYTTKEDLSTLIDSRLKIIIETFRHKCFI
jgi:hypothetical protein